MVPPPVDAAERERRRFIRHPTRIPVVCMKEGHIDEVPSALRDISHGGLRFASPTAFDPGDIVRLEFPDLQHPDRIQGEIMWACRAPEDPHRPFYNGMRFLHENMRFRARLVEQICHIEAYRRAQEEQGRALGDQQAAREWIALCADRFPDQPEPRHDTAS